MDGPTETASKQHHWIIQKSNAIRNEFSPVFSRSIWYHVFVHFRSNACPYPSPPPFPSYSSSLFFLHILLSSSTKTVPADHFPGHPYVALSLYFRSITFFLYEILIHSLIWRENVQEFRWMDGLKNNIPSKINVRICHAIATNRNYDKNVPIMPWALCRDSEFASVISGIPLSLGPLERGSTVNSLIR